MKLFLLYCTLSFTLSFCPARVVENPGKNREVEGMKPVYVQLTADDIFSGPPKEADMLQNFLVFRNYILIVERLKGVHVIDNTDPTLPKEFAFWNIPGIRNFTITNNVLFVPLGGKLVSIDVSDVENIDIISINEDLFQNIDNNLFPDNFFGSFECVNDSAGIVIDWEMATLFDPQCWR